MRITLDRARGTICGGGVVVAVDPAGEVLRPWLMAAIRQGWDFAERHIEMWDLGADQRREPMHCLTIISVARFLNPPKKKEPKP